jgi:putative ABC transport system permease protein
MAVTDLNGLAGRYLRAHLKRTLLTILGVVLSVALVCASGLFGRAIIEKGIEGVRLTYGAFYAMATGLTEAQVSQLAANAKADEVGASVEAGYAMVSDTMALAVIGGDAGFRTAMHLVAIAGRLPTGPGEIAIETWVAGTPGAAGIPRTLAVGSRLELTVVIPDASGLGAVPRTARESFVVTGLLEGWHMTQAQGRGIGLVSIEEARRLGGGQARYTAGFTVRKGLPIQKSIAEIGSAIGVGSSQLKQNTALLTAMGVGNNAVMNTSIQNVELILALIILIATVAVISNIFSISVLERVRQFGILRCVGTTPGQLRRLILREALLVSLIGIPLGIGSGILAVQVVIWIFDAISTSFFSGLRLMLPVPIIAGSAGLGVLIVFLSALGPSLRAARVPPLEAVMAPARTVGQTVRRRGHPIMGGLFGVAGKMAAQNLARNRKRFLVTVGSIAIGVSLFVIFASFLGMMLSAEANQERQPFNRDVAVYARGFGGVKELTERDLAGVRLTAGVDDVLATREANGYLLLADARVPAAIMGLSPQGLSLFRTHVTEGSYDPGRMRRENGVYITRSFRALVGGSMKVVRPAAFAIGDEIAVTGSREPASLAPVNVKVLGFIDTLTWSPVLDSAAIGLVATEELFRSLTGKDTYTRFDIAVTQKAQSPEVADILRVVPAQAHTARVEDFSGTERARAEIALQISILLYGLVVVISLIGALNIVNTIGTSLILRVREFGMLRAVGMTDGQLRGMVALEGMLYGLYAALPGSALGLLVFWLLFSNVSRVQTIALQVPWLQIIGACVAAMAIGILSALAPLRRIGKLSVVESIRAEE